jgi:hypothetical protein
VTLGIKNPEGSCAVVVTWANSSVEAINSFAKNCHGCTISNLVNADTPGVENAGSFCQ